ncbi:hypothetical protein LZC95_24240 [Pendulispora brunnea]|uniref:Uncharacterized protein n=1 Tax=Pendulispora brunnea TaxID=2905690 RepID=A0ABZ2KMN5_9BACT
MKLRSILVALVPMALGSAACSAPDGAGGEEARVAAAALTEGSAKEYVDIAQHLTEAADVDAWYALVSNLKRNFDDLCGDTFCEGEFSNIESLRYRCSVEKASGTMGTCVWVFGASKEDVTTSTGNVTVDTQTWRCKTPLAPNTSVHDFLSALSGTHPIDAKLPGSTQSIYDGLTNCL